MLTQFIDLILHLDVHLNSWAGALGPWLYLLLFAIIFCETGLVVTPFLPGDSLLFAVGALSTLPSSPIDLPKTAVLLIAAGILGDAVNYTIGARLGRRAFALNSRFFKQEHLQRTQNFYEKYGGKTIVLARFLPIIRTFAPFVAGIGKMQYRRFAIFNVVGAVSWVLIFLLAGYFFGDVPAVKRNFHVVIFAIIIISALPAIVEVIRLRVKRPSSKMTARQ